MNKKMRGRSIDTIFVLIVFSIFAFSVLMVLMLGASVYKNVNDISRQGHFEHTTMSYIWTKVKNFDDAGSIHVGSFNGKSALFIDEKLGDTDFRTVIYSYDGWLYELFSETVLDFRSGDGVRIIEINDLVFRDAVNGTIEVKAGDMSMILAPRSGLG